MGAGTTGAAGTAATLTAAQRDAALARFTLLRPFLEDGVPLTRLARDAHVALRTLRRWVAGYRRAGLAGLVRRPRADRGRPRLLRRELRALIEGLALQTPAPTAAAIHRRVQVVALEQGWPVPSYRAVAAVVQGLDPALRSLAHEGTKVYSERFDLLHRHEAPQPNALWQADHTQLDVWLLDDAGRPARPWLTVVLDDFSRAVAGYLLGFAAPSAIGTALALHQAIWRKGDPRWPMCGIPDACTPTTAVTSLPGTWSSWRPISTCGSPSRDRASRAGAGKSSASSARSTSSSSAISRAMRRRGRRRQRRS